MVLLDSKNCRVRYRGLGQNVVLGLGIELCRTDKFLHA